jgi:DNA-binding response OmpR family regulator
LAAREFRLLETLMREPGRIYSRMELLEKAWDYRIDPGTNVGDSHGGDITLRSPVAGETEALVRLPLSRGVNW